jgi:hypothetical protein
MKALFWFGLMVLILGIVGIIAQADVATRVDQPEKTAAMVRGISQSD